VPNHSGTKCSKGLISLASPLLFADLTGRLARVEVPTDAEEIWRYSRVSSVKFSDFSGVVPVAVTGSDALASAGSRGRLIPEDRDVFSGVVDLTASAQELVVGTNKVFADPVTLTTDIDASFDGVAVVSRLVIVAGENSQATIIHRVRSADIRALYIPEVELHLASGANVRYIVVQELGPQMLQIGTQATQIGRDATLSSMTVSLGGSYARTRFDAEMIERGGHNELLAVYFAERDQMHDFRTVQNHVAPRTSSDLIFKGAVAGRARSVYSGLIKIAEHARGTAANQTNRNLLLSPDASAESVPNLEIENNDVKCSHASAIGPIDDDERYYLESRGVPSDVADRLIVLGFFNELLVRIPDEELRARLITTISEAFDRRKTS
jgi:Fe-S cluster assembly protein SufD